MSRALIRTALRGTLRHIRHVTPVHPRHATGTVAGVYRQVERDFGMLAPPMSLHSPAPAPLAAAWAMLRESLVANGSVSRPAKEAVATAVSIGNACPYCVEVHSATLDGLAGEGTAIASDELGAVTDPATRAIVAWARAGGTRDGAVAYPFPEPQAAELIGVAVTFQYLNRMVNVFLGESPLPPNVPAGARDKARRVLGWVMRRPAVQGGQPGDSLELLDNAWLPADLAWAAGNPWVGAAFASAAAAIDMAADSVPESVRDLLATELSIWDGHPVGPSRAWVETAMKALPAADRAAGRLALLTAKASYQIDDGIIADYRATTPEDAALIELTAWASLTAARRVGEWLWDQRTGAQAA